MGPEGKSLEEAGRKVGPRGWDSSGWGGNLGSGSCGGEEEHLGVSPLRGSREPL